MLQTKTNMDFFGTQGNFELVPDLCLSGLPESLMKILSKMKALPGQYLSHSMTKPTKWPVCPAKTGQLGHSPSLINVCCPHEEALDPCLSLGHTAKTRLGDAQADLSLRWVHRSFCLFCHAAAPFFYHKSMGKIFSIQGQLTLKWMAGIWTYLRYYASPGCLQVSWRSNWN